MKRHALVVLAALAALLPAVAPADVTGTYLLRDPEGKRAETQNLVIHYKDDQHIRLDTGRGTYLLVTGPKVYAVSNQNGKITAIDLDTMPKFGAAAPAAARDGAPKTVVKKTGRTETIAGIRGDVYEISYEDKRHEVVLSADQRASALNKAFAAIGSRMGKALGGGISGDIETGLAEARKHGYGALLRSDQTMVLQSLKEVSNPASFYQLPPGVTPTVIPVMPAGMGPGGQKMDPAAMKKMQEAMQKMMQQQQR